MRLTVKAVLTGSGVPPDCKKALRGQEIDEQGAEIDFICRRCEGEEMILVDSF